MHTTALLSLLPALAVLGLASAQNTGSFSINASIPEQNPSTTGCVILAQLTDNVDPPVLQALVPVCHGESAIPSDPTTGLTVNWPIAANAADGQGIESQLLIYGQVEHKADRTDVHMAQAGCVMKLTADQAQYLLGRSLTWNNGLQQLWDNTDEGGFILTPDGSARAACAKDDKLLPDSLWFADPGVVGANDTVWQNPITLVVPVGPVKPVPLPEPQPSGGDGGDGDDGAVGIQTSASESSGSATASASSTATESASVSESASTSESGDSTAAAPTPSSSDTAVPSETDGASPAPAPAPSPTDPTSVIGGGLIGIPTESASSSSASPATSPSGIAAIQTTECSVSVSTVTEVWTTTVTATPTAVQRRGLRMFY